MKIASILFGIVIAAAATWSAFVFEYKHFYDFLLVGLLCILLPFMQSGTFTVKRIAKMWVLFFLTGIVVDLLLVLLITKGWYYNYSALWEYVVLYIWVYPAGGLVLVASYLEVKKLFRGREVSPPHIPIWILWALFLPFAVASIALIFLQDALPFGVWSYSCITAVFLAFTLLSGLIAEIIERDSYIHGLAANPIPVLFATAVTTYINTLVHEYPNVYAKQWVYVVDTGTFLDSLLLGIPVMLWLLWPFLTMGALTIFYRTSNLKK